MSCQICGRRNVQGAKLCADCRAARKRAYDATITQPLLAMMGAGTVSRTLSRLRRSDSSPEAKARRAARKAKAAAAAAATSTASAAAPSSAQGATKSRTLLWILLSIGLALAGVAGWYLPTRTPSAPAADEGQPANASPAPSGAVSAGVEPAAVTPSQAVGNPVPPPLPNIVEQELVPHSPAPAKPASAKHAVASPKVPATVIEAPTVAEVVRPPAPVPAPPPPQPAPRVDPWQQMSESIGRCPGGFLDRVVCEQRIRLQYCDGRWGQVPQCPGGPSADHD
jgi:hypothetical protein